MFLKILLLASILFTQNAGAAETPKVKDQKAPCWAAHELLTGYTNEKPDGARAEMLNMTIDFLMNESPDCLLAIYADKKDSSSELREYIYSHIKNMVSCKKFNWCSVGTEEDKNCQPGKEIDYCKIFPQFLKKLDSLGAP